MRRFVKTFTVKRHVQFTVVQDSDGPSPFFEILRWAATDVGPELAAPIFRYVQGDPGSLDQARRGAVQRASALAVEDRIARAAMFTEGAI